MSAADEYLKAKSLANGSCPIEAGLIGNLTDHECVHGRLPADKTNRCGCWKEEGPTLKVVEAIKEPLSPQIAREIRGLRRAGLSVGAIMVVLDRYFHANVTYSQVQYHLMKAGVSRPKIAKGRVVA